MNNLEKKMKRFFLSYGGMTREEAISALNGKFFPLPCCKQKIKVKTPEGQLSSGGIWFFLRNDGLHACVSTRNNGISLQHPDAILMKDSGSSDFPFSIWSSGPNVWGLKKRSQREQFIVFLRTTRNFLKNQ